ncbi:anti-sigma-F factor Fin family protein [Bacillus niameyensis]|uniref:anti-sigma-F factor Fin family protein n=1 Tax=Bacillus niameyensis TaxID=1522308 RepID=UPI000784D30D|nr:anti-sigma-F factor Fin family protein [Bacillus niameyensis]
MIVHYYCRHCTADIGTIDSSSLTEEQLGIQTLSENEKQEMVSYGANGDIRIQTICENCQEALEENPDLHQYDYLIH